MSGLPPSSDSPSSLDLSPQSNDVSIALDLIRALAAQAVCVGHAFSFFGVYPSLRSDRVPYMQNLGVIVFFWLSGFLIAHALVRNVARDDGGFWRYAVDRFARVYSAYVPALLFIWVVDSLVLRLGRYEFPTYLTAKVFLGTLLMFQNYPGSYLTTWSVPSLGSGGPLWTLSVEFHIYLFVGALFFFVRARGWLLQTVLLVLVLVTAAVPLRYLFGDVQEHVGTGLFSLWLLGFATYFVIRGGGGLNLARTLCWLAALGAFWWYGRHVTHAREYAPEQYVVLAGGFAFLVLALLRTRVFVNRLVLPRVVRVFADYSYSLYLVHYTILYALFRLWTGSPRAGAWLGVVLANAVALALAWFTEFRHKQLAGWLRAKVASVVPSRVPDRAMQS